MADYKEIYKKFVELWKETDKLRKATLKWRVEQTSKKGMDTQWTAGLITDMLNVIDQMEGNFSEEFMEQMRGDFKKMQKVALLMANNFLENLDNISDLIYEILIDFEEIYWGIRDRLES